MDLLYSKDGGAFTTLMSVSPIELVGTTFNNLVADLSEIGTVSSSLLFRLVVDPAMATKRVQSGSHGGSHDLGAGTFRFASFSPGGGTFVGSRVLR